MIKINGKKYNVNFGIKAIVKYEKKEGKPVGDALSNPGLGTIISLLHCALVNEKKEVTEDYLLDEIDKDPASFEAISKMMEEQLSSLNFMSEEAKK